MFDFSKKLKKQKKVFYSCVVDDNPKFYWQGYIFVNILIKLANVNGNRIFVHLIKQNPQFEIFLRNNNVNVRYIEPWGDKKYCNKLQQIETKELQAADYVFFCDTDIAITEDLSALYHHFPNQVLGKIVDFDNPSIDTLKQIYDFFEIEYPRISTDTLNSAETFDGNFNGGLYGMPSSQLIKFGRRWKYYSEKMLGSDSMKPILGDKINHIDQISFSLALKDLNMPYQTLGYEYNCPTHIKRIDLLDAKLSSSAKVIHYHDNLTSTGLLTNHDNLFVNDIIVQINEIIKGDFNNALFWSYRYAANPELGSGVGSRGSVAQYKLKILKSIGLEKQESVMDVGCGDLEIVKSLSFKKYTGVDISAEAISNGKEIFPNFNFYNYETEKKEIPDAETIICLDVLIHQPDKKSYDELINMIAKKAQKRVVVSGYEDNGDTSHMCFYYENVKSSLEKMGLFKYVYKVGEYRGLGLYVGDKGHLLETKALNDIDNSTVDEVLGLKNIDAELLLETVTFSRANFGWHTKHYPRLYEYPWLLKKLGRNLVNLQIADFGAGVTPLPLQLASRGAQVYTVDKHEVKRDIKNIQSVNEWGFLDYSILDDSIKSYNQSLTDSSFENNSLDVWYSISVVEHMPAEIRRKIFNIMVNTLKDKGQLLLTIDLVKDTQKLWNMAEGKIVEDEKKHGTLDSLVNELELLGFDVQEKDVHQMPKEERVDIAMISAILKKEVAASAKYKVKEIGLYEN